MSTSKQRPFIFTLHLSSLTLSLLCDKTATVFLSKLKFQEKAFLLGSQATSTTVGRAGSEAPWVPALGSSEPGTWEAWHTDETLHLGGKFKRTCTGSPAHREASFEFVSTIKTPRTLA